MDWLALEYQPALPEILLGTGICLVLLVDLFLPPKFRDAGLAAVTQVVWRSRG